VRSACGGIYAKGYSSIITPKRYKPVEKSVESVEKPTVSRKKTPFSLWKTFPPFSASSGEGGRL